jgi:hypothetical protein
MPTDSLPTKLKKEPLVDAVFELRFSSTVAASNVIPAILLARLKKPPRMERLPASCRRHTDTNSRSQSGFSSATLNPNTLER